jgi:hypothetical protein
LALMLCQRIGPFDCLDFAWYRPNGLTFREFVASKLEKTPLWTKHLSAFTVRRLSYDMTYHN